MIYKVGYFISVLFTSLTLFWLGLFKFTPTEANSIQWLVSNHFAMAWMLQIWSLQMVSNIIGTIEIIAAICILVAYFVPKYAKLAGILPVGLFIIVVSFLCTTPGIFKQVDGFWVTEFFIFKDFVLLGSCLMVVGNQAK